MASRLKNKTIPHQRKAVDNGLIYLDFDVIRGEIKQRRNKNHYY
jgi:hypothetical protein